MAEQVLQAKYPDHVPENLYWDHHLVQFLQELGDPYVSGARLHEGPDMFYARDVGYGVSAWVPTRYALLEEIFLSPERFSSQGLMDLSELMGMSLPMIPICLDPPEHTVFRQAMNPIFSPRAVKEMEDDIRATCKALIADFQSTQGCEYISEFAIKFPTYVFLGFMGLPREMAPQFLDWDHTLWRSEDVATRTRCARAILHYLQSFVETQRERPTSRFMRGMFSARVEGRPLTMVEILGMTYLVYTAGLDTVYSSLGWHMLHLAKHPDLQDRLRSRPEDIPRATSELLRAYCVVTGKRTVTRDMDFHGVSLRQGDIVLMPTALAARDPLAFDNPHEVNIERQPRVMAFGTGHHTCVGAHLARREIKIVLEEILSRFKNIRVAEGDTYRCHAGAAVHGVDYLPLAWDPI